MALLKKKSSKSKAKKVEEVKQVETKVEEIKETDFDVVMNEDFVEPEVQTTFNEDSIEDMNEDVEIENLYNEEVLGAFNDEPEELVLGAGSFTKRTSKPGAGNKCYITRGNGGWSWCIQGSPTDKQCNVLANCVGYACGRFNEVYNQIKGTTGMKYYMLNCNAENFIERAQQNGLEISSTPVKGGIMVWQKGNTLSGNDGAGHVAFVEEVYDNNHIYTSESGYGSSAFWNSHRYNTNGRWGLSSGYKFRGCIINPAVGKVGPTPAPTPTPGPSGKFNIGDKVVINGPLYVSSNATTASGNVSNKVTNITRKVAGTAHPYNTSGDLGWMDEASIKMYEEPKPTPAPQPVAQWPKTHTVKKHDTLSGIAAKYYGNGDYEHYMFIARANNIANPNIIHEGQKLTIPEYKNESKTLNVGDKVKIVSAYAASSTAKSAPYTAAIGWDRKIMNIYAGRNYPYAVGDGKTVVGFCKAEGLKKL